MNRFFGKAKAKEPGPTMGDTISNTESRADSVDKKIQKLDVEIKKYGEQMRRMRPGRAQQLVKQKAMRLLKQKRQYENQHMNLQQQGFNMEQQAFAIQTVKDTQQTVNVMKQAKTELTKGMKKININDVENLQDDMEDLLEDSNEMQEILGRSYGVPDDVGDEDLEAELDMLADMDMDPSLLGEDLPDTGDSLLVGPTPDGALVTPAGPTSVDEFGLAELN